MLPARQLAATLAVSKLQGQRAPEGRRIVAVHHGANASRAVDTEHDASNRRHVVRDVRVGATGDRATGAEFGEERSLRHERRHRVALIERRQQVRGGEVVDLLAAFNTGHEGGAGTVHANSPAEVPARLEALAALGGLDRAALHSQLAAAVHVVWHVGRDREGRRRLDELAVLRRGADGLVNALPAWRADRGTDSGMADLEQLLTARKRA